MPRHPVKRVSVPDEPAIGEPVLEAESIDRPEPVTVNVILAVSVAFNGSISYSLTIADDDPVHSAFVKSILPALTRHLADNVATLDFAADGHGGGSDG